jgi:hypothetical protein
MVCTSTVRYHVWKSWPAYKPKHRCHLSSPSPVQQYLIDVSLSSVVHHIVFIVVIMLHLVIVASSSRPPSYWLDLIIHSPILVWLVFVCLI